MLCSKFTIESFILDSYEFSFQEKEKEQIRQHEEQKNKKNKDGKPQKDGRWYTDINTRYVIGMTNNKLMHAGLNWNIRTK